MNSNTKFQFKSIDVDTGEVQFLDPHTFNSPLSTRREMIKAWNEESRLREAELETYYNEIHNSRDELVQETDSDSGAQGDKHHN